MKRYLTVVAVLALMGLPILAAADGGEVIPEQANWTPTPAYSGTIEQLQRTIEQVEGTIEQVQGKQVVAELKKILSDMTQSAPSTEQRPDTLQAFFSDE